MKEMKREDVLNLTDEMIREYNRIGFEFHIGAEDMRHYVRDAKLVDDIVEGKLIGFQIKCPKCGDEYGVDFQEYNYDKPINCYTCGLEYRQCDCIIGVITND